jgi:hypothetical protein
MFSLLGLICFLFYLLAVSAKNDTPSIIFSKMAHPLQLFKESIGIKEAEAGTVKQVQRGQIDFYSSDLDTVLEATLPSSVDLDTTFSISSGGAYSSKNKAADTIFLDTLLFGAGSSILVQRGEKGQADASVKWQTVEFVEGASVQRSETSVGNSTTTKIITLPTPVNQDKAFVVISRYGPKIKDMDYFMFTATLQTPVGGQWTELRIERAGAANKDSIVFVAWQVVELDSAYVQYGESTLADGQTSLTLSAPGAFTTVDASKSFLVFSTRVTDGSDRSWDSGYMNIRGELNSAGDQIIFTRLNSSNDAVISWYLVEMLDESLVQRDTTTLNSGSASSAVNLPTAVVMDEAFSFISYSGGSGKTTDDDMCIAHQLTADTTLTLSRMSGATTVDATIAWQVVWLPPLHLLTPNGGEVWQVGEAQDISWSHSSSLESGGSGVGGVHLLDIKLSTNDGTSYPLTIASGVEVNLDNYSWTIPASISGTDIIGEQMRVKIVDTDLTSHNFDESDNNFIIKGTLTITQPPDTWKIGQQQNISWTYTGNLENLTPNTVTIKLSTDGGSSFAHTLTSTASVGTAGSGSWSWTIPSDLNSENLIGTDNLLKVILNYDPQPPNTTVENQSTNFTLKGQIYQVSPTTTETWLLGETHTITWQKYGHFGSGLDDGTVDIYYSDNGGLSYDPTPIIAGEPAGTDAGGGSYDWTIPSDTSTSNPTSKLKVVQSNDDTVFDVSADFYLLPSLDVDRPVGGEIWRYGENQDVKWTTHGTMDYVVIKYKVGAGSWQYVQGAAPADFLAAGSPEVQQTFSWSIPDNLGNNNVYLRVCNRDNENVYDEAGPFSIKGTITVNEPHLDELVKVTNTTEGNTKFITWGVQGSVTGTADIRLSKDGGNSWPIVLTEATVDITSGSYEWTVLDTHIGSNCKIKVALDGDEDATTGTAGVSDAFKTVPYLKLTYPNSTGLSFNVGDEVYIKWTPDPADFGTVDIRYDNQSGTGGYTGFITDGIASNNIPSGETEIGYKWTIPDVAGIVGNNVRIKVYQTGKESEVYSSSLYDFSIEGSITITGEANGGYTWEVGTNKEITWDAVGDMASVNILYAKDGVSFTNTVDTGVSCASGSNTYLWQPIPNNVIDNDRNTNIKFKVTTPDGSIFDTSDSPLTIQARLTLAEPNPVLYVDDPDDPNDYYTLSWTTDGIVNQVKLAYDTNSGLGADGLADTGDEYQGCIASCVAISNVNAYDWDIPNAIGTTVRVKVMSAAFPDDVSDESNDFEIKGKIKIIAPDATVKDANAWIVDNAVAGLPNQEAIQWRNYGDLGSDGLGNYYVTIKYASDGVNFNDILTTSANGANGPQSFNWTIPDNIGITNKIKVSDNNDSTNVYAESEGFEIKGRLDLIAPDGGETYSAGVGNIDIQWKYAGTLSNNIDLYYDTNSGLGADGLADTGDEYPNKINTAGAIPYNNNEDASNICHYSWATPTLVTDKYRVKIVYTTDTTYVKDESSGDFEIEGSITITGEANGGYTWEVGTNKEITWDAVGDMASVNILYAKDGVSFTNTVDTGVSCASGSNTYLWQPIPNNVIDNDRNTNIKFKVTTPDGLVSDVSDNPLTIQARLTLAEPNPVLYVDDPDDPNDYYTLSWTTDGIVNQVKLAYDTNSGLGADGLADSGDEYQGTINAGQAMANTGSYDWDIPNAIGTTVRVKVMSAAFPDDVSDESNDFEIKGQIKIVSPTSADTAANAWLINSASMPNSELIEWRNLGDLGTVNIYFSDNGGTEYLLVSSASGANGPQNSSWQVPDTWGGRNTIGTDNKIKIADADDETNVFGESDNFEIKGQLNLTSAGPGGTYYIGGSPIDITWDYAGNLGNIDIFFSSDGGSNWELKDTIDVGYAQPYQLTVPNTPTSQGKIKLEQVSDRTYVTSQTADPGFSVKGSITYNYPNKNPGSPDITQVNVGDSITIQWGITGSIQDVAIDYDKYSGNGADGIPGNADDYTGVVVAQTGAAAGTYPWSIPSDSTVVSDNVRIRVRDYNDSTVYDTSEVDFKIKPKIEFLASNNDAPLGGEEWIASYPNVIKWTPTGFASGEQVKIRYSDDGGNTWPNGSPYEITEIAASALSYTWSIPESVALSNKCVIRIHKLGDTEATIDSNWFTIKGELDITQPDGGIDLPINNIYTVKWNKTGNVGNVALYYSVDAAHTVWNPCLDATDTPIQVPASDGQADWKIPDNPSSTVAVKITPIDAGDPTDSNVSASDNAIIGSITIDTPNPSTGDTMVVDSSYNISWTPYGSISAFDVYVAYDNNKNWVQIGNDVTANNLPWTVTDNISDQVYFRIEDAGNPNVYAETTAASVIKGSLVIDEPHISEQLEVSDGSPNKNITWTKHGSIGSLLIEGSIDDFTSDIWTIVSGWSSDNPYPWAVDDKISDTVKIRITTMDFSAPLQLVATSDNFIIKGKLTITDPTSTWYVGDTNRTIQWNATGTVGNVKLEYYDGAAWNEIIASTPAVQVPAPMTGLL